MTANVRHPRPVSSLTPAHEIETPVIAVVMGVSGSGKTTVAALLAAALGAQFVEGDDLHPNRNIEKMHAGIPLTDADRLPWLEAIAGKIDEWRRRHQSGVVSCSALKRAYRDIIIGDRAGICLVYLKGPYALVRQRMAARHEHFMPVGLLDSQFAILQEPAADENAIVVDIANAPNENVDAILRALEERLARSGARR